MRTNHILILLSMLLNAQFQVQVNAQDCDKDISTNPAQPYNNHPFFHVVGSDIIPRYNPWINSDFNIGEMVNGNVPPLYINNQIGWQIPNFVFGETFEMKNPFASGTTGNLYSHLHPTGMEFEHLDYKWEDGWELLYVGLGFYPNGEGVQIQNTQRAYDPGVNLPSNPKVPYILMYNRYRGVLRVFANVFTTLGSWDDIVVQLRFNDDGQDGLSGILRHLEPFDRALSQTTNVKLLETYNPKPGGIDRWFSSDFQLGFDPCICGKNQKWFLNFRAITSFEIDMVGRGVEVDMPIADGTDPNYDNDWLTINSLEDELSGGNQIFTKMDGLVEDYKDAMDKYDQEIQEYADYQAKKDVITAFEGFIVDGTLGLIPASGPLKSWFLKPKPSPDDVGSNFASYIKGASKGLFGYGYDQLSMAVNPKTSAPKPPDMPTASYSQMRFSGEIKGTLDYEEIGPFFIPGSYNEASSLSFLDPFNYPAYNAPVGLSALLQTPSPILYFDTEIEYSSNHSSSDPCEWCPPTQVKYETNSEFQFRFKDEFVVALNPSLDFDMGRTATYVQLEVTLENDYTANNVSEIGELTMPINFGGPYPNLSFERFIQEDEHQIKVYQSKWVLLEDLNQYVYSLNTTHELDFLETYCSLISPFGCESNQCVPIFDSYCLSHLEPGDPEPFNVERINFRLSKVKMKVLHDYYFTQIGSNGEQVNTTQIFAYELFNLSEGINELGSETGWQDNESEFEAYIPGLTIIGNEIITPSHPVVQEVNGNDILVSGQDILIGGSFPATEPGLYPHNLTVQAQEQIRMAPGTTLLPAGIGTSAKTHLRIRKDFYDTSVFDYADNSAVSDFCNNSAYQANSPSAALRRRIEEAAAAQELDELSKSKAAPETSLTLYPNPARSELSIKTVGAGIDRLTIFDMATRPVMQASPGGASLYRMDIGKLAPGVYIVRAECAGEVLTEKLVVAR